MSGRPPIINDDNIAVICESLRRGNCRDTAFAGIGVGRWAARLWNIQGVKDIRHGLDTIHARFVTEMASAEKQAEEELVGALRKRALEPFVKSESDHGVTYEAPSPQAAMFLLERRGPKNWGIKKTVRLEIEKDRQELLDVAEGILPEEWYVALIEALASKESEPDGSGTADGSESEED